MLTSLYYYDHYRPFIIKDSPSKSAKSKEAPPSKKFEEAKNSKDFSVQLNKSLKKDVVNYARNIYQNVIGMKNISKTMLEDSNEILNYDENKARGEQDPTFEETLDYYYEDLEGFVEQYNQSNTFSSQNDTSGELEEFQSQINESVENLKRGLKAVGLRQNEDGTLYINEKTKEKIKQKSQGEVKSIVADEKTFFSHVYNQSQRVLENPMSKHMNFQNLKYFYNYDYDKVTKNTFRLVESGMLIDLAL